jgi:hypothetical protein
VTTAAKLLTDLHSWSFADGMRQLDSASIDVLHVGEIAYPVLAEASGWRAAHGRAPKRFCGVPCLLSADLGRGWRVLNRAGAIIAEGEITGP